MSSLPLVRGTTDGADCCNCPLAVNGMPHRPVRAEGPEDPKWIIIGEGPGGFETHRDKPFCGPSGQVVNQVLGKIGAERSTLWLTNACLCQPPSGADVVIREQAAQACSGRLMAELARMPGLPVLTLGAVAARAVIPKAILDAIDPPETIKALKKAQKLRQQPTIKQARVRRRAITKEAERRLKKLIKHHEKTIITLHKVRYRARPAPNVLLEEILRVQAQLERKANEDAIKCVDAKIKERTLKAAFKAKQPKKAKKHKQVKITDICGTLFDVDIDGSGIRPVIPAIHPAALLRGGGASIGGSHTPDMAFVNLTYDAGKIAALAAGKDIRLKLNVDFELVDQARASRLFLDVYHSALEEGACSIDLETYVDDPDRHHALMAYKARIKVIGIATKQMTVSLAWEILPSWALSLLQLLVTKVASTYHNGLYDRTVLRAHGFIMPSENWDDTLLGHHAAFPGNSHRLQVVASQFYGVEPWKCLRGDVAVVLPDRSTINIAEFVRKRIPEVLSYEAGRIVIKKVVGWHAVHNPGQEWVVVRTARSDHKFTRGLIVTPDHRVLTERGLIEASDLVPSEDRIAIDEPLFSTEQRAAALGTLLGDSSIFVSRTFHKRPWEASRASLRGGHANQGLRDCKVAALPLGTSLKKVPAHERMSKGKLIHASDFYHYGTKWAFQYMELARLVYDQNWKRRIKPEALAQLGRRGLAMMYMDDGDLHNKHIRAGFATNGFPWNDVELFAQWLRETYGATSIYDSRSKSVVGSPYCALSTKATRNMLEDLRGYIHPAMKYKTIFDDPFKDVQAGVGVYHVSVLSVDRVARQENTRAERYLFDHRYCISVEDTKLFLTNYGVVSNSEYRGQEETPEGLATYNAKDTGATHALRAPLALHRKRTKTEAVYELDKKMSDCASRMHLAGMPIDRDINSELLATFSKNVAESRRHVEDIARDPKRREMIWHYLAIAQAGKQRKLDPPDFEQRYQLRLSAMQLDPDWKWKIGAGKHIAALLQAMGVALIQTTEHGEISTKKDVLEALVDFPIVRDILSFRENDKLLATFIWPAFDRLDSKTGLIQTYGFADEYSRIHPIWNVHRISGRWASQWPVVSNVPKDKWKKLSADEVLALGIIPDGKTFVVSGQLYRLNKDNSYSKMVRPNLRRQIRARKGRIFVGFDFGQIEARVIALISGDPFLCAIFAEGRDPHIECARIIWPHFDSVDPDTRKQLRENVKNIEYGAMYMAQLDTLHQTMLKAGNLIKKADLAFAINALLKAMAGVVAWQHGTIAKASAPPYEIKDFVLGRRRTWPMGQVEGTEAVNYGVQTAAASIMNKGMANMLPLLDHYREVDPIAQIHDAAIFECWADDAPRLAVDVKTAFEQHYERDGRSIPFVVDVKIGQSWDCV